MAINSTRPVAGAPESGPDTARAPRGTYGSPTASVPDAHIGHDYEDEEYDDLYSYDYSRPTDAVATGATAANSVEGDDGSAQEPATKRPRLSGPAPDSRLGTAGPVQAPGPSSMVVDRPAGGNTFVAASATPSIMPLPDVTTAAYSAQPLPAGAVMMPGMFYVMGAPPSGMPSEMQHMQMFMMPVASGMFQPPAENFIQAHQPVAGRSTAHGLQTAPSVVTGASSSKHHLNTQQTAMDRTVSGSLRNPSPSDVAPSRPQRSAVLDTFLRNTDVPKDTRHHAAYFEKLQDKYPTRDEELNGRFVDDDPNDDATLLSKFSRIQHRPLKQSTAREYGRTLELFESFLRRRNLEHLLAPDVDIEFSVLKLLAHVMADKYRTQRGQHKLAYQSIHKFFQCLWEALLRVKHRHVPEETKEQVRSSIMCMKGDPNYDNPTARRELPLLDEQDAYFQLESLYNPNRYYVTPRTGSRG